MWLQYVPFTVFVIGCIFFIIASNHVLSKLRKYLVKREIERQQQVNIAAVNYIIENVKLQYKPMDTFMVITNNEISGLGNFLMTTCDDVINIFGNQFIVRTHLNPAEIRDKIKAKFNITKPQHVDGFLVVQVGQWAAWQGNIGSKSDDSEERAYMYGKLKEILTTKR